MNKVFGLPMGGIMITLLVLLGVGLLAIAVVAWRRPVIFKLGVRNIPRRKAQTILIVVGLMLSTLIISAALGTGDTLDHSVSKGVYDLLGDVDELVVYSQSIEGNANNALSVKIDDDALALVEETFRDDPTVDGILPGLMEPMPVLNEAKGQAEPDISVTGIDPAAADAFGGVRDLAGNRIDLSALGPNEVVLSEQAADDLDAEPGDALTAFYHNMPIPLTVAAVGPDTVMTGVVDLGLGGMVMPLDRLQALTGQSGKLSLILISNAGGVRDSLGPTDHVVAKLETALAGKGLGYQAVKRDLVDDTTQAAEIFTNIFLVMGLFSIGAGILLIVLIFTMLATERRTEMGIARAVGTQRRQLIEQFVSEGAAYAVLAGLIGAALGVAAAVGLAYGMGLLFGNVFDIEPYVRPRSLVVAYGLGVVITFAAVIVSSWRISRLNIVAAVRDIPEVSVAHRTRRALVWAALLLVIGGLMLIGGQAGDQAFPLYTGLSLLPFGAALAIRFFGAGARPVFTTVGLYLVALWLMPDATAKRLFGDLDGGIEMFFVSGIFLVLGATMVIVQNTDLLLAGITRIGGLLRSALPAIRTAVSYPGAARGRTGMTIAMFSLIIFSLVMIATINQNFVDLFLGDEANAGWDVRADAFTTNPIDDFTATLQTKGGDTGDFTRTGTVATPHFASQARLSGGEWKDELVHGMDDAFITGSTLAFQQRATGYETDEAIVQALLTEPNVAVVDSSAVEQAYAMGEDPNLFKLEGLKGSDEVFDPFTVELADPDGTQPATVKVIGVIDSKVGSLIGMYANRRTTDAIYPATVFLSYFVALNDPDAADAVAKQIEAALLTNGVQATSIRDELKDNQQQATSFLYLFEGFMALGLIVGISAVGVIAFRTVVERRQQIGVLRAIGYQRSLVSLSFLIETAFVVGTGVLSGTVLGLLLARNLFDSEDFASASVDFSVPWGILAVIVVATVIAALLMTWVPSRQAARIAPADALRYE